jgi:hypothetical protein
VNYRYLRDWSERGFGKALVSTIGWKHAVPRIGNFFPGITIPIPNSKGIIPDISFCIEEQAQRISDLDRPLVVLWSGGVDSTLVLTALSKAKRSQPLFYTVSKQSIECASPELMNSIVKLDATPIEFNFQKIDELKAKGYLFITGTHADSITLGEIADSNLLHDKIWDMSISDLIKVNNPDNLPQKNMELYWETLTPLFDLMPFEKTASNLAWWLDFTSCWNRDDYDMSFRLNLNGGPEVDYINFFGSESFQLWAMQDTRDKALNRDAKGRLRKWVNDSLGCNVVYVKNIMEPSLNVSNYNDTIGSSLLVAIDKNYKPIVSRA